MNSDRKFTLKPFELSDSNPTINISGNILRADNKLKLDYLLQGDLSQIVIPVSDEIPTRKDELWQTTCWEFFIGTANSSQYWEFNLATTGDWNVYRFSGYRQGMTEEKAFDALPFRLKKQTKSLTINLEINLDLIVELDKNLDIAITAVIESNNGELSYWALAHPEAIADFHHREGFIIHC
ncbi:hypothetical protein Xen7305DRAFT_00023640 [Xenococcus sp. PCC 7305]|nr:hypothetical protein Xen7305DRAFT_00023640 [Xenococcus sp. PCC 7305]